MQLANQIAFDNILRQGKQKVATSQLELNQVDSGIPWIETVKN
jgi:hypothetical protein